MWRLLWCTNTSETLTDTIHILRSIISRKQSRKNADFPKTIPFRCVVLDENTLIVNSTVSCVCVLSFSTIAFIVFRFYSMHIMHKRCIDAHSLRLTLMNFKWFSELFFDISERVAFIAVAFVRYRFLRHSSNSCSCFNTSTRHTVCFYGNLASRSAPNKCMHTQPASTCTWINSQRNGKQSNYSSVCVCVSFFLHVAHAYLCISIGETKSECQLEKRINKLWQ